MKCINLNAEESDVAEDAERFVNTYSLVYSSEGYELLRAPSVSQKGER